MDQSTMERLAFIKHLHREAEEKSRKPQPYASTSLLTFHDAVEMFLQLASEEVNATGDVGFLEYWNDIKQNSGIELTKKPSLKRMNKARVSLKHHGNRPHKNDLESYRAEVRGFFVENTPKIFNIEYTDISLVQLIKFDRAREKASKAEEHLANRDIEEAICQISSSFNDMFDEFENRIETQLGYVPFPTSYNRISSKNPLSGTEFFVEGAVMYKDRNEENDEMIDIGHDLASFDSFIDDLSEEITHIYTTMKMTSLGIDHGRFQRFESLRPRVSQDGMPMNPHWNASDISEDDVRFCIDFLAETALRLQELPLDFEAEIKTSQGLLDEW